MGRESCRRYKGRGCRLARTMETYEIRAFRSPGGLICRRSRDPVRCETVRAVSLPICDVNAAFPHRAEVILAGTSTFASPSRK
jgi:hypothetical protein